MTDAEIDGAPQRQWRTVVVVLVMVVLLAGLVFALIQLVKIPKERRVTAAQAAVERRLRLPPVPNVPAELGEFHHFTGEGYSGPTWNISGLPHLLALRTGHFANGKIPILIYVWEPTPPVSPTGEWRVERIDPQEHGGQIRIYVRYR